MINKKWTVDELELLKVCDGLTINELLDLFPNRSTQGIYVKCSRLNIKVLRENIWTEEEKSILINNNNLSIKELCKLLPNRSYNAIQSRCNILGLEIERKYSSWLQWELDILIKNQDKTLVEICKLLPHKHLNNIYSYIKYHNLSFKYNSKKYEIIDGKMFCNKCQEYKTYDEINFDITRKEYHTCKTCKNKMGNIKKYKRKYNINLDFDKMYDTYLPEEWYEFYYSNRINKFPYEISRNNKYMSCIIRYAIEKKLNKYSRKEIISIDTNELIKMKLRNIITNSSVYEVLNNAFPEFDIKQWELKLVSNGFWSLKENVDELMKWYIKNNIDIKKINIKLDIPKIFNISSMRKINYHRLNSCIQLYHHYSSYYEWLSTLYPEWGLEEKDFNLKIAKDGTKLNSMEELLVYEFIIYNLNIKIKSIGLSKKNKFYNDKYDEFYLPDFTISKYNKFIFDKPVIIEYFGLYIPNDNCNMVQNYISKTHRKNEYYKSNPDIYFIDLYPTDLKNSFQGVRNKLTSFFMDNFNIEIDSLKDVS